MTAPSPEWLTVRQVATYAQRHPKTVERALRLYKRTNGRKGLRGAQANGANSCWRIRPEDAERWCGAEPPKSLRRLKSA